jgi:hypothetical protein
MFDVGHEEVTLGSHMSLRRGILAAVTPVGMMEDHALADVEAPQMKSAQ